MRHAYAPYSGFRVGAALETIDGALYQGCNMENASYGVTICAERTALGAAIVAGERDFRRIVIATADGPPVAPCGACRQALAEFGLDLAVTSIGLAASRQWSLRDLLPDAFTAEVLLERPE